MNECDIAEILGSGENSGVEFKSEEVHADALAVEVVGMLNSEGGLIFLGVNDFGAVEGLSKSKEEWVANISRNNINPPVSLQYETVVICSKTIGLIKVPKGKDKPYQTQQGRFYVRVGSTNRLASQIELMRLFQQAGYFHYDSLECPGVESNALDRSLIDKYFNEFAISFSSAEEEEKLDLMRGSEMISENNIPTLAGLLVFGVAPQANLPQVGIHFAHFGCADITGHLIDKQEMVGPLPRQIDNAMATISSNLPRASDIQGTKRVERAAYPATVFRELLVNACVHRNWAIEGSQIRVFLFSDRLEFRSPGRLPNTVSVEKLAKGVSAIRNPVIMRFLSNLRYMDRLGRGLPMVCKAAKDLGKNVFFEEVGEEFRVTLEL